MGDDLDGMVYRESLQVQNRYDYYLLSVAAACIAFAVHRTTGQSLNASMVVLGSSVLCWGVSFTAGVIRQRRVMSVLYANCQSLLLRDQGVISKELIQRAEEAARQLDEAADGLSEDARRWGICQTVSLGIGALFFLLWHVLQMARCVPTTQPA